METFRKCKQACVDALKRMPDHYPEEPFFVRALTELQEIEETISMAIPINGIFKALLGDTAERRSAVQLLKKLKYQFYTFKSKSRTPHKGSHKRHPRNTDPEEIKRDLELLGYTRRTGLNPLIGRKTKRTLPIFLITLSQKLRQPKNLRLKNPRIPQRQELRVTMEEV
ncbi:hypothetical protein TNCV_1032141 [Trichonephila clavipes]|nr:hypothetical protein TNCV_1032141 [Trichonephila clavipes]